MLARVENGRAKTLAENSPVNIAALVDFVEYTLDDIKGSISHKVLKDATLNNMVNNVFLINFNTVTSVAITSGIYDPVARKIYV